MSRFVTTEDFESGEFLISNKSDTTHLQSIIDRVEVEALQDLLGKTLYDLFIADLNTTPSPQIPQDARFTAIYDPIYEDETIRIRSEGFIAMLKMLIWFEFVKTTWKENTPVGIVSNASENSKQLRPSQAGIEGTYNRGIKSFHAVLDYIIINSSTYPEYEGKGKARNFISWL